MLHDRTRAIKVDRRMVILTDGCSRIGSAEGLDAVVGGVRCVSGRASERAMSYEDACERCGTHVTHPETNQQMAEYGVQLKVIGFNFPKTVLERTDTGEEEEEEGGLLGLEGMDPQRQLVVTDNARMLQSIVDNTHGAEAPEKELRSAMMEAREALALWGPNLRKRANSSNNNLDVLLTPRLTFNVQVGVRMRGDVNRF